MKLLGWMHRKFRQNSSGEPLAIINGLGHPCSCLSKQPSLDEQQKQQQYHAKSNTYSNIKASSIYNHHPQKQNLLSKSFAGMDSARIEEIDECNFNHEEIENSSAAISGFFDGFLKIGTLGSDQHQLVNEPETPTFSFVNVTEKETELTENDLKLINEELEKVLNADANTKDGGFYCNDSSSARTSQVSAITLCRSSTDQDINNGGAGGAGGKVTTMPLQGYLFGSSIDLPAESANVSRKEPRPSLGELFQMNKMSEEKDGKILKEGYHKRDSAGENNKSMKKFLKWGTLKSSTPTADSVSAENKLHKLLQIFNRKVHPESNIDTKRSQKSHKNESSKNNKNNDFPSYDENYYYYDYDNNNNNNVDRKMSDEDIMLYPSQSKRERTMTKDPIRRCGNNSNPSTLEINRSDSNGNREYWIKTDADYLVLEL